MKKTSKIVIGLLLIAGISACSSDRNLPLSTYVSGNQADIFVNPTSIKGFIPLYNPNATVFSYTLSGGLAGCQVIFVNADGSISPPSVQPSGTTRARVDGYMLEVNCGNLATGTYSGTVSISTTSGGYNYNGSLPLTITF
ncbi:hypothetical protein [Francisella tularensis]|uniref:hypothetical protein n=1 Tax=Francisella tularensis TaxID=263 RepID=UPI0008F5036B|nr:hypothetical protein [Francisella tularensis]APA82606.1 hypothetical protein N894_0622 [Francisella tularensis subsp. novicida PA10-7858]